MGRRQCIWVTALITASIAAPALAQPQQRNPFEQGRWRLALGLGLGSFGGGSSFSFGGAVSYYPLDGFEVGTDAQAILGGGSPLARVSPQIRYVFYMVPGIQPYVGVFYRRRFGSNRIADDTAGGRAGFFYIGGGSIYIGIGVTYEVALSGCNESVYTCRWLNPELVVSISL